MQREGVLYGTQRETRTHDKLNGEEVQYFLERGTQIVSLSPDFTR
jgi:hypothetical protein